MEFHHIIILFFAFQSLLMGIFFILRRSEIRYANFLLAIFLFSSAWLLLSSVLFWSNLLFDQKFIHFDMSFYIPFTIFAPFFFFYLRNICEHRKVSLKFDFYHFIPLLYVLVSVGPYYFLSASEKFRINEDSSIELYIPLLYNHIDALIVFTMLMYASVLVWKYWNKNIVDFDLLIWTRTIIIAFVGCVLSFSIYYFLYYLGTLDQGEDYVIILVLSLFVLMISYFAFNYSNVFNRKKIGSVIPFVKYRKTGLSKRISEELKEKLENLMQDRKPYLDVEIRLDNIAELLGVNRHQASQVINEHFDSSFFDFINGYRVYESKRILRNQKKKINLSEVAYLSGFNNTVSFNIAFKKMTGTTPSEYRRLAIEGQLIN